jgi:hypothetical protein
VADSEFGPLKESSFYWVRPVYDVDLTPEGFEFGDCSDACMEAKSAHWSQNDQPARFCGLDENGQEKWLFIGIEEPDAGEQYWPVCWIGPEIILPKPPQKDHG